LSFFVLHFRRLHGHESFFLQCSPRERLPILAGEEGFEPPYPVLETGVLTVGRLP
jgi:hypothetical protein